MRKTIFAMALYAVLIVSGCAGDLSGGDSAIGNADSAIPDLMSISVESTSPTTAVFTGSVNVGKIINYSEFGFVCSLDSDLSLEEDICVRVTSLHDGSFSHTLTNLFPGARYHYCAFAIQNGLCIYGESAVFTTLSASANCYIVSDTGQYRFKTVKGNSSESVGSVSSAEVLWESFGTSETPSVGDLIKSVEYADGHIAFQTADTFREGNAVIAAKDASGNILWSWHIWFTDYPREQVYYNNAGTMMDRNLGATSAAYDGVGAFGLLYQWGRKDPFLGSSSTYSSVVAESTIDWPSYTSGSKTVEYAIAHPTVFIGDVARPIWCSDIYNNSNNFWSTSDTAKSIYDPCPVGWRVPDYDVWEKALGSSRPVYTSSSRACGIEFSGKLGADASIWYPAAGYRRCSDGSLYGVKEFGLCASTTLSRESGHVWVSCFRFYDSIGGIYTPNGIPVRCLKE